MIEHATTRSNPMIDPALHVWGWEIPVYLFLGGLVAGMMIITGWFIYSGRYRRSSCVCHVLPLLGMVLLSIGMAALFLDLEHKLYFWRLYTTFEVRSPMSWGSWVLLLVYPALGLGFLIDPPTLPGLGWLREVSRRIAGRPGLIRGIGGLSLGLGILLGIYTGVLLSSLGARPLWASPLLGPLFLVSGLSSAAAFVHLIARDQDERETLAKADTVFLGVELILIALLLIGLVSSTEAQMQAARLFLGGPYTAVFWIFVVILGIVVPLVVQPLAVTHRIRHTPIAPLLVLLGGVALRMVVVAAGQLSHWAPF